MIKIKRIYEPKSANDGYRILVDRLWPRGVSKEKAHLDLWLKEIAPSTELRKWFNHDPKKWLQFQNKYIQELKNNQQYIDQILELEKKYKNLTFLYGAKDTVHNEAIVLINFLKKLVK